VSATTEFRDRDAEKGLRFGQDLTVMLPAHPDSDQIRSVFNGFPAAVGALCAVVDGEPRGLVATSMTVGVSYDPPMVLFSVSKTSSTWPSLRRARRIGISVLGEEQGGLCRQLASKGGDRFKDVDTLAGNGGALFVGGAISWLECSIEQEVPAGDHAVVLLQVHAVGHAEQTSPLVFHRSSFPLLRHRG
jgi:flavin reductase (DIM6/NTAB) family NADH-FMN oxidoreductase RutF